MQFPLSASITFKMVPRFWMNYICYKLYHVSLYSCGVSMAIGKEVFHSYRVMQ